MSSTTRPASVRDTAATAATVTATTATAGAIPSPQGSNCPRSIFGRLGIRKPSLLSLHSPQLPDAATARTFSLDDLLRPPPRRKIRPESKPRFCLVPDLYLSLSVSLLLYFLSSSILLGCWCISTILSNHLTYRSYHEHLSLWSEYTVY